VGVMG